MRKIKMANFIKSIVTLSLILQLAQVFALQVTHDYDVTEFGAIGDAKTVNTEAIQRAIDWCHEKGGGLVCFKAGIYVSGTIYLKSNVIVSVEVGAQLLGSANIDDYPDQESSLPTYDKPGLTSKALIYAENQENISIIGGGVINGNGEQIDLKSDRKDYLSPSFKYRPRIIHIRNCEHVSIEDITLINSGSWVQTYQQCTDLKIHGIRVDSRENPNIESKRRDYAIKHRNNDGLDLIDCRFVTISDAHINSGDDAICIKSFSPDKTCSNIAISNCHVSSNTSGIKIGTETAGRISDIVIQNCTVYDTRGEGIAIMTVDGSMVERINISNIILYNIKRSAIFIRQHRRNKWYGDYTYSNEPQLCHIFIDNIQGSRLSGLGCSITGIEGYPIKNLMLSRIDLEFDGNGEKIISEDVPEILAGYPKGDMFGARLPAFGFFIRHVEDISISSMHLSTKHADSRPAILAKSVRDLKFEGMKIQGKEVRDISITKGRLLL